MTHLDTRFLIHALVPGSRADRQLRAWLRRGEGVSMSAIAWAEFLCGPVEEDADAVATARGAGGLRDRRSARARHGNARRRVRTLPILVLAAAATVAVLPPARVWAEDGGWRERLRERWTMRQKARTDPPGPSDPTVRLTQPGDYTYAIAFGGMTRHYRVHVPLRYDPTTPAPLMLAFHGGGGDMNHQADDGNYGQIARAEREGAVVVFPNGSSRLASGRLATWNAGNCCASARDRNVDDVGFVRRIIANVTRQLTIDRARIVATGMSNGGMMAYRLACEMSDVVKAIAAVAGTDNTRACEPPHPVSILHIHARDDDHVLFDGGGGPAVRDPAQVTEFTSVPETIARWVRRNGCRPVPERVLDRPGAHCDRYSGCRGDTRVELCVTDTGGHSWPGAARSRGALASTAISANEVMWAFFTGRPEAGPAPARAAGCARDCPR